MRAAVLAFALFAAACGGSDAPGATEETPAVDVEALSFDGNPEDKADFSAEAAFLAFFESRR